FLSFLAHSYPLFFYPFPTRRSSDLVARKPAAITLDILLPDLDGWEVLTRLKRDAATSDIPVVVVSVVDNPELGIALGALDYFVKDRKSTRLNSSHGSISYAVFCLKK